MAIKFQCPSCKAVRSVNERLLGRQIQCPECGVPFQLPTREEVAASRSGMQSDDSFRQQLPSEATDATPQYSNAPSSTAEAEDELERIAREERILASASTNFVRPRPQEDDDMDMTPMVDVTFLLLIFFMITASFSVQKSIQRPAKRNEDPSTNAQTQPEKENKDLVTVQVDEFNAFNVVTSDWDRPAGSKQDLIISLKNAHAGDSSGNQPTKIVIRAHEDCIHAAVIDALDAGREAGFESFEVDTVEQFD